MPSETILPSGATSAAPPSGPTSGPQPEPSKLSPDEPIASRTGTNQLSVTTWGSSSCPPTPAGIKTQPKNVVEVTFEPSKGNPCTADLAAQKHTFTLPDDAPKNEFTLRIRYNGIEGSTDIKVS